VVVIQRLKVFNMEYHLYNYDTFEIMRDHFMITNDIKESKEFINNCNNANISGFSIAINPDEESLHFFGQGKQFEIRNEKTGKWIKNPSERFIGCHLF